MHTLGNVTTKVVTLEESYLLAVGAIAGAANMPKGTIVKLEADGTVVPVAATSDIAHGMLTVGSREAGDRVTVNTQFSAIVRGLSDGATTIGMAVACSGLDTDAMLSKYKEGASGDQIVAVALSDAADGEDVQVGILRNFVVK